MSKPKKPSLRQLVKLMGDYKKTKAQPIRDKLESFGIPVGNIELQGEQRIQCPWCSKGWLEPTPPEYKDPAAVVYCSDCSSVFKLVAMPEVSP